MRNAPAFQFFARDWLADTEVRMMSDAEVRVYIDLLCYCWEADGLPTDPLKLAKLTQRSPEEFAQIWIAVGAKFVATTLDSREVLYNSRLLKVRNEQQERRERDEGKSKQTSAAANARWEKAREKRQAESSAPPPEDTPASPDADANALQAHAGESPADPPEMLSARTYAVYVKRLSGVSSKAATVEKFARMLGRILSEEVAPADIELVLQWCEKDPEGRERWDRWNFDSIPTGKSHPFERHFASSLRHARRWKSGAPASVPRGSPGPRSQPGFLHHTPDEPDADLNDYEAPVPDREEVPLCRS